MRRNVLMIVVVGTVVAVYVSRTDSGAPWHPASLDASALPFADRWMDNAYVKHDCGAASRDVDPDARFLEDYACTERLQEDSGGLGFAWRTKRIGLRHSCAASSAPQLVGRFDCVAYLVRRVDCGRALMSTRQLLVFMRRARGRWRVLLESGPAEVPLDDGQCTAAELSALSRLLPK